RTRFVGQLPRDELRMWYARARVVAIPSWYDNFPMAGLEGMACGRPIVCTSRTGLAEIVRQGGGRVVPVGDPDALAAALRSYIIDPALAEAQGTRAREVVKETCHPLLVAERREGAYLAAVERHECRRATRARWFRSAAPRLACSAPAWHRAVALEAARTPWKHFYLRTAEHLVDLLVRHTIDRDSEALQGLEGLDLGCTPHVSVALA